MTAFLKVWLRYFLFEGFPLHSQSTPTTRLPSRPCLLYIFSSLGSYWASSPIRAWRPLPPCALCGGIRSPDTCPILVMGQKTSKVVSIQDLCPSLVREFVQLSPCNPGGSTRLPPSLWGLFSSMLLGGGISTGGPSSTTSRVWDWMQGLGSLSFSYSLCSL